MKTKPPCYGCEDRYAGCHSECAKYKAWRVIHEEESREEHKARCNSSVFTDIDRLRMARVAKRRKKGY